MKVLHINNYKNNSGWSKQAEMHVLALDAVGVDVYPKHVNILNNTNEHISERIIELEKKRCVSPDVIIQNVLPPMYVKTGRAKCVGYFVCETDNFIDSGWVRHINMMDGLLVPCHHNKEACINSGVTIPVHVVPECIDVDKCRQDWPLHNFRRSHPDKFLFLVVAEWTRRKNIEAVLQVFHAEFSPAEPVELIIKTTPVGMSNYQEDITNRINSVKQGLKIYTDVNRYKRENIICGFLSEVEMYSLYKSADVYVCTSRGEAFNIGAATAMAMGVSVVSPDHSGLFYLTEKNSFIVDSRPAQCYGATDSGVPDIYTGNEGWFDVSIPSLREQMRNVYAKKDLRLRRKQQATKDIEKFSFTSVGNTYKNVLEKIA